MVGIFTPILHLGASIDWRQLYKTPINVFEDLPTRASTHSDRCLLSRNWKHHCLGAVRKRLLLRIRLGDSGLTRPLQERPQHRLNGMPMVGRQGK
jgi:hypothetical protein